MRKSILRKLLSFSAIGLLVLQSCKDDSNLTTPLPVPDQSFTEEFDSASAAISRGWKFINKSEPAGPSIWQDGGSIPAFFNAYSNSGSNVGFIGTDYLSVSNGAGTISNWLVSPLILMQNGDKIVFYTRAYRDFDPGINDSTDYSNRLQLRVNTNNESATAVGSGYDPGSFSTVLVDINPFYYAWYRVPGNYGGTIATDRTLALAYPTDWTRFEGTVYGLAKPTYGRFAFRYFIEGGGPAGMGTGVGIDKVSYTSVSK